jgi:pyrroloquinoline-quinone synthase
VSAAPWTTAEFEARIREVPGNDYHDRHPFNLRMHAGELSREEIRGWILNRFHYQRHIPIKDALILAKLETPELRRTWIRRVRDHDGTRAGEGGIERWLGLGRAAGLDRELLLSGEGVLPGVRLAVEGYVNLCRLGSPVEAVAASLTELFAPDLMHVRLGAFERHYRWIDPAGLHYFRERIPRGGQDGVEALALVLRWARTRADQEKAVAALRYKCDVLWSLLDAVDRAYR